MNSTFLIGSRVLSDENIKTGSRFLASTMHEVRTPIQTIISTTELLSETALNKEQLEYIRQIEFSANVLLQLANDVLDYTKITSSIFNRVPPVICSILSFGLTGRNMFLSQFLGRISPLLTNYLYFILAKLYDFTI